ncbi:MAG: Glutamyl-tRNA reductase [Anaerolineales bacterium]|nr:Glutamyl-tRNA reductase [Anaerolineales bacterium]
MNPRTLLILGGYGNTGRLLAQLLLQETDVRLVLAGRTVEKADSAAAEFNSQFDGERVSAGYADAADVASLEQAFDGVDMVIVASSTAKYAREVATASLSAGIDYLDIQYSTEKIAVLQSMSAEIERASRCFITEGGFHPGLPAALVRYVAPHFDRLDRAIVGSVIKLDWSSYEMVNATAREFLEEIDDFATLLFKDGRWQKARFLGMLDTISMDFGGEFGRQYCVPMFLEEMRAIPEMYPTLQETGFYIAGFNWFVDWLVFPVAAIASKVWPERALEPLSRLMVWGLNTFSKPPYGALLKVEAAGEKAGQPHTLDVTLYHPDGYTFTAIPVVACMLQYLDGSIRQPGLWTQANLVEPNRLMHDMQRMGVEVAET